MARNGSKSARFVAIPLALGLLTTGCAGWGGGGGGGGFSSGGGGSFGGGGASGDW